MAPGGGVASGSASDTTTLYHFLLSHKVDKGSEFTHTSLYRPAGSFYVPSDRQEKFYDLYASAVERKEDVFLTERHRCVSPFVIDLDFRFSAAALAGPSAPSDDVAISSPDRLYTSDHVRAVAELFAATIAEFVDTTSFHIVALEKPSPSWFKGGIKDGIHFMVPDVVTRPSVQYLVRQAALKGLEQALRGLPLTNPLVDVLDEAVIERNNWMMYGSKKQQNQPYAVTRVYRWLDGEAAIREVPLEQVPQCSTARAMVSWLSIRNKLAETPVAAAKEDAVSAYEQQQAERRRRKELVQQFLATEAHSTKNACDCLETVQKLVDILKPSRVDTYADWMRLGWCLRNIDHRLLDKWIEISKKSSKYVEGECQRLWNTMRIDRLGMGTLRMWAKQDNVAAYNEIIRQDVSELIDRSISGTHHDVARVVHRMYRYDYVCANIRFKQWYEFRNHRWRSCDSAVGLRLKLSNEVAKRYLERANWYATQAAMSDNDDDRKKHGEKNIRLTELANNKLQIVSFKDNIIRECCELFYVEKFDESLDSLPHLLGFENGVYDLQDLEFREGRPDDYVSFTTGTDYVPYDEADDTYREIREFWSRVFPTEAMREYVLTLLASFVSGQTREERFHIWTGSGCHAAGTLVLLEGDVCKPVEQIQLGDRVIGDDGAPREVEDLFRGHGPMYDVVLASGIRFPANEDHLATVVSGTGQVSDVAIRDLLRMDLSTLCMLSRSRLFAGDASVLVPELSGGRVSSRDVAQIHACSAAARIGAFETIFCNAGWYEATDDAYVVLCSDARSAAWVATLAASLGVRVLRAVEKETHVVVSLASDRLGALMARHGIPDDETEDALERYAFEIRPRPKPAESFYGFQLSGPSQRYLLAEGCVVTHNSNGKSMCIELYEKALGDYCCKFPIALLTQKRVASNAACSEVARAKGKRFACLQEPSEDEKLNIGLMKELTGGDKIMARMMYHDPIEFKPQWHIALLCNHLPHVPSDDGGTWRRIRVVEFKSKFVEKPTLPNEFPMDFELSSKFERWKNYFASLLVEYYKKYKRDKLIEPDEVLVCTREYQRNNDHMADFIDSCFEKTDEPGAFVTANEAFSAFKAWVKHDNIPIKVPKKRDVQVYMDKTMCRHVTDAAGNLCYRGYKIKELVTHAMIEDAD
jgi:P4 family phage/plasmid primase-like protien